MESVKPLEEREVQVVGETDNPEIAWTLIETHHPDLILLHSCLPPTGGVPFCEQIAHRHPEIKVILTDPDPFATNNLGFAQASGLAPAPVFHVRAFHTGNALPWSRRCWKAGICSAKRSGSEPSRGSAHIFARSARQCRPASVVL
ncbi:MAG: response regulator [Caldilineae bacterium]|nr:MAG: response regulator [Caldilineae bacterium]